MSEWEKVAAQAQEIATLKEERDAARADCAYWAANYEERGYFTRAETTLRKAAEARAEAAEAEIAALKAERDELKSFLADEMNGGWIEAVIQAQRLAAKQAQEIAALKAERDERNQVRIVYT